MKKLLLVVSLLVIFSSVKAQYDDYQLEAGIGWGMFTAGSSKPNLDVRRTSLALTYYYSDYLGIGGGIAHLKSTNSSDKIGSFWELPVFFSVKTLPLTAKWDDVLFEPDATPQSFLVGIVNAIVPSCVGVRVGPTMCYFSDKKNAYSGGYNWDDNLSGYELKSRVGFAVDAELQLSYVIYNFKFGLGGSVGYMLTNNIRNFEQQADNGLHGIVPRVRLRALLHLAYAFDGKNGGRARHLTERELKYK